jgi:simple sugar transport system permease protein
MSLPSAMKGASMRRLRLPRLHGRTELYLAVVIAVGCAAIGVASPSFLSAGNFVDLLENYSVMMILALGAFVVLVAGGIDVSFAAIASVAQYVTALVAAASGVPAPLMIAFGLALGVLLGCVNAVLIYYFSVTSIIATIATMSVYFSFLMYFTHGNSIYDLPDWWTDKTVFLRFRTDSGTVQVGLPLAATVLVAVVTFCILKWTKVGRQLFAMGGNPEAARRIGINPAAIHFFAYGYLGLCAAIAGLLQANRVGEIVPNAMVGRELNVIAAAVLGGASLAGGRGTVVGVVLGVLLLAIVQNGLNLLGVSTYYYQAVVGLVFLVAISVTSLAERTNRRTNS